MNIVSEKSSKKLVRNGQSVNNNDKKGPQKIIFPVRGMLKKIPEKNEKQNKKIIWEEEKEVLKAYLHETYPLTKHKND